MKNVRKFVSWDVPELETLKETAVYQCMEKLNNGGKLSRAEKDSLFTDTGRVRRLGWEFNFSPYMKTYLVKLKYYGWQEIRAFDKTHVRRAATTASASYILKIVELSKEETH